MADVPLLKALVSDRTETGDIRPGRFELRERRDQMVIIKIVIKTEVLLVTEAVVKPHRELVATFRLHRRTYKFVAIVGRGRDKLKQVNRGGILASKRNDVLFTRRHICENARDKNVRTGIGSAIGNAIG